jgi:DNA/RNA-binding domain of Phe-tRNA-synthetase-like protein
MSELAPTISSAITDRFGDVKLIYAHISLVRAGQTPPRLKKVARSVEKDIRERVPKDLGHERLVDWATLARAMDLANEDDFPAPRALVHSVLRGRTIPKINVVVDIANIIALSHLTPVGVFDLESLNPPIMLRLATPGDSIVPIGGSSSVPCVPGEIVYSDQVGVFSRYARDADRSKVSDDTSRVLLVIDGTPSMSVEELTQARDEFVSFLKDADPTARVSATALAEIK